MEAEEKKEEIKLGGEKTTEEKVEKKEIIQIQEDKNDKIKAEKKEEEKKDGQKEEEKKEEEIKEIVGIKEEKKDEEIKHDKKDEIKKEDEKEEKEEEKEEDKEEEKEKKPKKEKKKKKAKKEKKEGKNSEKKNLILTIDEENNACVDCGKSNPSKVSINNGVILCEECAIKHEELGHSISFIKDIDDDFDGYLLNFIVFGSNSKFKRFLISEKIDPSFPIEKKYLTKACFFYRNNLKRKVKGEELLTQKDYEDPNEIIEIENIEDNYPEFEHYKMKSKVIHDGELQKKEETALNKLSGSIFSIGKKMYGGIKFGANYVAKKTEGPTKSIIKGANIGAGFVGKKVTNAFEMIKKNVGKGKKNEIQNEKGEIGKENPPNLEQNQNNAMESGRPLQAGDEGNQENGEKQKEQKRNVEEEKQEIDNNEEEKIDV